MVSDLKHYTWKWSKYALLEGMVPYGCLLLAPAEGRWPSATWRALWALWIAVKNKNKLDPHFFIYPPTATPPYPWHRVFFSYPHFFIGAPPYTPPRRRPPYPLHRVFFFFFFFFAAILDFEVNVKKHDGGKEWRREGGDQAWSFFYVDRHVIFNIFAHRWNMGLQMDLFSFFSTP